MAEQNLVIADVDSKGNVKSFGDVTITVYNCHTSKDPNNRTVTTWHRKILTGCSWRDSLKRTLVASAVVISNEVICRVPKNAAYISPAEWDKRVSVSGVFTFAPGDIVVKGQVSDTISDTFKISDLITKYKRAGVMKILLVRVNTDIEQLAHYRLEGE